MTQSLQPLHLVSPLAAGLTSMNNILRMQILHGAHKLVHIILCLRLCESASTLHELHQCMLRTDFEQEVNVAIIFEESFEFHDVRMSDRSVNFDFMHHFLLGAGTIQESDAGNNLAGVETMAVETCEFVADCEAAFA